MGGSVGLLIEIVVAGLMAVTIGYCIVLDRRLRAVRQDEQSMRKTVTELGQATERAERAIDALRHTLGDCDRTLAERLRVAERYAADLEDQIRSGDDVLNRITRIVSTALGTVGAETAEDAMAGFGAQFGQQPHAATPRAQQTRIGQTLAAAQAFAVQAQARANGTV